MAQHVVCDLLASRGGNCLKCAGSLSYWNSGMKPKAGFWGKFSPIGCSPKGDASAGAFSANTNGNAMRVQKLGSAFCF